MTSDPADAPAHELDEKQLRANYIYHAVEGGAYMGGSSFVAPNLILPRIVELLGGPSWVISLTPALTMLGFNMLPVVTAHRFETLKKVMPLMVVAGALQRVPFLFAGLLLVLLGGHDESWLPAWVPLLAVLSAPLLSGIVGGLIGTAWQELVAKTVLNHKRSSLFAWRFAIASVIGIFAGGIIAAVLERFPGTKGYGVLYLIGSCFLALSYFLFIRIKEPVHEQRQSVQGVTLVENLSRMVGILRTDRRLLRYVTVTFLTNATLIMVPFLPLFILRTTGKPDSFLGLLVTAQMVGAISGNLLAGVAGDRYGSKAIMIGGRIVMALTCACAGFIHAGWGFWALFFAQGMAGAAIIVGAQTMNIEICPYDRRATYLAIMAIVNVPAIFIFSFLGSRLWDLELGFSVLSISAAVVVTGSIVVLAGIAEPRKAARAAAAVG